MDAEIIGKICENLRYLRISLVVKKNPQISQMNAEIKSAKIRAICGFLSSPLTTFACTPRRTSC